MKSVGIIGAGIVGLATAYKLQQKYPDWQISIWEKEKDISQHQTGRNSGVIHSGIYYKTGSLKQTNCINGYRQLLNFCDENTIEYDICGKLIVATDEKELPALKKLYENGKRNGLQDLKLLDKNQIKNYEPYAEGIQAVFVPQTGIVDYVKVSRKLQEIVIKKGGKFYFDEKVLSLQNTADNKVELISQKDLYRFDLVINCAGLYSDKLAETNINIPYKIVPFRGEYYQLKPEKSYLVKNLIYPVPNPEFPFLGVHFTRRISGKIDAGPNAVLAFGRESYHKLQVNWKELFDTLTYSGFWKVARKYWKTGSYEMYRSFRKKVFVKALQKMIPEITENDIIPASSGIRAQAIDKQGNLIDDFLIVKNQNIIHIGNAPSPAATASLAIADYIVSQV